MADCEIFVKPSSEIKQINPIPKFDLILDNLKSQKFEESWVLAKLKRKTKSEVNMVYLPSKVFI